MIKVPVQTRQLVHHFGAKEVLTFPGVDIHALHQQVILLRSLNGATEILEKEYPNAVEKIDLFLRISGEKLKEVESLFNSVQTFNKDERNKNNRYYREYITKSSQLYDIDLFLNKLLNLFISNSDIDNFSIPAEYFNQHFAKIKNIEYTEDEDKRFPGEVKDKGEQK